jgi:hypothetical protein
LTPSNIVIRRIHTRTGLKWGPLTGLTGVVIYGLLMYITGTIAHDSGPGWLNLFVLLGLWNSIRFAALIPVSLVRLLRVRHQEKALRRAAQRAFAAKPGDNTPAQAPTASAAALR